MKIEIIKDHYYFKIMIDGLPHVVINKKQYAGFHSWMDSETQCCIEFVTKTNKIKVEYDSKQKWMDVLKALNDNL